MHKENEEREKERTDLDQLGTQIWVGDKRTTAKKNHQGPHYHRRCRILFEQLGQISKKRKGKIRQVDIE